MGDQLPIPGQLLHQEIVLMNGGALDIITLLARLLRGETLVKVSCIITPLSISSLTLAMVSTNVHLQCSLETLNVPYCESSLLHRALRHGAEFDCMTASHLLNLCRCDSHHQHHAKQTYPPTHSPTHTHTPPQSERDREREEERGKEREFSH